MKLRYKIWLLTATIIALIVAIDVFLGSRAIETGIRDELARDAKDIRAMLMATRRIYHQQFLDSGLPINDQTIGFLPAHALSRISRDFPNWSNSGMVFNNVSDRPRNPANLANSEELEAMAWFRANPQAPELLKEFRNADGTSYYLYTAPIWTEAYCIRCHGEREDAPPTIAQNYDKAFGYQVGDLRGVMSIKLPAETLRQQELSAWKTRFTYRLGGYLALLVLLGMFLDRTVTSRVAHLEHAADRLAAGDYAQRSTVGGSDEIGTLSDAFNQMAAAIQNRDAALKEREELFRDIFDQAAVGMSIVSPEGQWLQVNQRLCEILGYPRDELMTLGYRDITPAEHIEHDVGRVRQMLAGVRPADSWEKRYIRKDGSIIWVRITTSLTRSATGEPRYFVTVTQDITESKQIEQERTELATSLERRVAERTASLEQAIKELETFSYSVSHDLRAPLRAINGFAQLLLEGESEKLSDDGRQMFERIIKSSDRMGQLIDDILEYSCSGRQSLTLDRIDLDGLVRKAAEELRREYPAATIDIGPLPAIVGDATMLGQVMQNLIGNALKFTAKQEHPRIEVGCRDIDGERVFYVGDNGVGFDMRYADKLFGMFQRMHTESQFPGTGVGLAIVKRLIERHGGRIWAEATPGRGATFYFTLGTGGNA